MEKNPNHFAVDLKLTQLTTPQFKKKKEIIIIREISHGGRWSSSSRENLKVRKWVPGKPLFICQPRTLWFASPEDLKAFAKARAVENWEGQCFGSMASWFSVFFFLNVGMWEFVWTFERVVASVVRQWSLILQNTMKVKERKWSHSVMFDSLRPHGL